MSDSNMAVHPATSTEDTADTSATRVCEAFSDPAANVVFKTSDGVIFRVEDLYLRASSTFFKDMLSCSTPSSSEENPLPIEETAENFLIVMLIVVGRPQDAIHLAQNWEQAKRLYTMMEKYQFDVHQPWFSDMCGAKLAEAPLEALFLACNRPCIDTTLARLAITDGFAQVQTDKVFDAAYFYQNYTPQSYAGNSMPYLLEPTNTTIKFGLRLGMRGLLAYNSTFAKLAAARDPGIERWYALAESFAKNARLVESEMRLHMTLIP